MAAAEIQVANPANLVKIESFLNDSSYKEVIENSSTFNSRLCAERRMRMPFLDPQTGVAQSHCNLYMTKRQRMPGLKDGQLYSYPSQRWRKARRQYLTMGSSRWGFSSEATPAGTTSALEAAADDSSGLPTDAHGEDSRDGSQTAAKDDGKEWFYEELAMSEVEGGEEAEAESDEDYYDDTYANRRRRRTTGSQAPHNAARSPRSRHAKHADDATPKSRRQAGRGRKRAQGLLPYEVPGDAEKPYGCELCGAKYKTRPGLTYHFTHTHKEGGGGGGAGGTGSGSGSTGPQGGAGSDGDSRDSRAGDAAGAGGLPPPANPATEYQDSYVTFLNNPHTAATVTNAGARRPTPPPRPSSADTSSSDSTPAPAAAPLPPPPPPQPGTAPSAAAPAPLSTVAAATSVAPAAPADNKPEGDKQASPSPYCDFCLGDDRENKKTGGAEELVSCSDCGRSGHPSCLQFTVNMLVSTRKYRWQCIECKCCSVCGTSDNDDQLLFCDDCDRGYHMYCLAPPLLSPPEGSWSCALCIQQFHTPARSGGTSAST